MSLAREPGAGAAVTGLFLGSLAIAGAVALVTAPITPRMAVARTSVATAAEAGPAAGLAEGRTDPLATRMSRLPENAGRD